MVKKQTKYIQCACGRELISLEKWEDENGNIDLSIWERGYRGNSKLSFFERIRWSWKILKTGKPFCDQIILKPETIEELISFLKEFKNDTTN